MNAALADRFLEQTQNPDGGWGYHPGDPSMVEPTGAVMLALADGSDGSDRPAWSRAHAWLEQAQHPDGGWGFGLEDPESHWATAWAILALARRQPDTPAVRRGVRWLWEVPVLRIVQRDLTEEIARGLGIDPAIAGWPWRPGEAAWVEPTALALLALAAAGALAENLPRIPEAVRYLADRRCRGGGWNFGNPFMLGTYLPPRAHPTAWALLALGQVAPDQIRDEDVAALRHEMAADGGALALALGVLALETIGRPDPQARARLAAMQQPDGSWAGSPYVTALARLALGGGWPWQPRA
ncbi:MAG: hypothetical protein C4313_01760 [Thermoflexus sp.]|uniref:prenyltransferase/squalene oxidase repeat-containing protein n=1 Tax=Thermoflexus sp. TaxID=1969742 RepID=UPI003331212C